MKQDAAYNDTNPTQKFKGRGNLEEFRTKSTQDCGAKNIKIPGKQIASAVRGIYLKLVISLITFSDKSMRSIFDEKSCQAIGIQTISLGSRG